MAIDLNFLKNKYKEALSGTGRAVTGGLAKAQNWLESPTSKVTLPSTSKYDPLRPLTNVYKSALESVLTETPKTMYDISKAIAAVGTYRIKGKDSDLSQYQATSNPGKFGQKISDMISVKQNPFDTVQYYGKGQMKVPLTDTRLPEFGLSESSGADLVKKGIKAFEAPLAASGAKQVKAIAGYLALGGGINTVLNSSGNPVKDFYEGSMGASEKAALMVGGMKLTNPMIDKLKGGLATKSLANVAQGVALDKSAGFETTSESLLLDLLMPGASKLASKALGRLKGLKSLKKAAKEATTNGDVSPATIKEVTNEMKANGIDTNETAVEMALKDEVLQGQKLNEISQPKVEPTDFKDRAAKLQEQYKNDPELQKQAKAQEAELAKAREMEQATRPLRQESNLIDSRVQELESKRIKTLVDIKKNGWTKEKSAAIDDMDSKIRELKERSKIINREIHQKYAEEIPEQREPVEVMAETIKPEPEKVDTFAETRASIVDDTKAILSKLEDEGKFIDEYEYAKDISKVSQGKEMKEITDRLLKYAETAGVEVPELKQDGTNYLPRVGNHVPDHTVNSITGRNIEDALSYDPTKKRTKTKRAPGTLGLVESVEEWLDFVDNTKNQVANEAKLRNVPEDVVRLEDDIINVVKEDLLTSKRKTALEDAKRRDAERKGVAYVEVKAKNKGLLDKFKKVTEDNIAEKSVAEDIMDIISKRAAKNGIKVIRNLEGKFGRALDADLRYLGRIAPELKRAFADFDRHGSMGSKYFANGKLDLRTPNTVWQRMAEAQADIGKQIDMARFMITYDKILNSTYITDEAMRDKYLSNFIDKTLDKTAKAKAWETLYDNLGKFSYDPKLKKELGQLVRDLASEKYVNNNKIADIAAKSISKVRSHVTVQLITSMKGITMNMLEAKRLLGLGNPALLLPAVRQSLNGAIFKKYPWASSHSFNAELQNLKVDNNLYDKSLRLIGLPFTLSETAKNKIFLNFFDLQGQKAGLKGDDLDLFVYMNMAEYAVAGGRLQQLGVGRAKGLKGELLKSATQFMGYPLREGALMLDKIVEATTGSKEAQKAARKYLAFTVPGYVGSAYLMSSLTGQNPLNFMVNIPFLNNYWDKDENAMDAKSPYEFMTALPIGTPPLVQLAVAMTYIGADLRAKATGEDVDIDWETTRAYSDAKKMLAPYGAQIFGRTIPASEAIERGDDRTWDGEKVKYTVDNTPKNVVLGTLYGKGAFDEAKQYQEDKKEYGQLPYGQLNMDEKETAAYDKLKAQKGKGESNAFYQRWLENIKGKKNKEKEKADMKAGKKTDKTTGGDLELADSRETLIEEIKYSDRTSGHYEGGFVYKSELQEEPRYIDYKKFLVNSSDTTLEKLKKENSRVSKANEVFLDDEIESKDKDIIYGKLGFKKEDIEFNLVATLPDNDKASWLSEQLSVQSSKEDMIKYLKYLADTEAIGGGKIFTSGVAKRLGLEDLYKSFTKKSGSGSGKAYAKKRVTAINNASKAVRNYQNRVAKANRPTTKKVYSQTNKLKVTPVQSTIKAPKITIKVSK